MTEKNNIVVGVIFHTPPESVEEARQALEKIPFLRIIYFKQSKGKLWVVSSEDEGGKR